MSSITGELRRIIENTAIMDEDTGSEWSVISKRMALSLADAIDAEHERRMEQQSYDLLKAHMRYIAGVVEDYKHGIKRKRKEQE